MNKIDLNYDGAKQKLLDAWDEIRHLREAVKIYRPLHTEDCCCVACGAFNRFCVEKEKEDKKIEHEWNILCSQCGKTLNLIPEDDEAICYMEHKRICGECYDKFVDEIDVNDII